MRCRNLLEAGRLEPGEGVIVIVDAPLIVQGPQLADAVKQAGDRPRLVGQETNSSTRRR